MKTMIILAAVSLLAGCASFEKAFANRVACTLSKDGAIIASMYGPLGIASKVTPDDAAAICK